MSGGSSWGHLLAHKVQRGHPLSMRGVYCQEPRPTLCHVMDGQAPLPTTGSRQQLLSMADS
jgi:hypothetical protein